MIAALEKKLDVTFPESVKAVWRRNDGQKKTMLADTSAATPCLPTLSFLSTKEVARIWKEWGEVRKSAGKKGLKELDAATRSAVPGVVKPLHSSPKWIPLWAHPTSADYVGLDFDPDKKGIVGQIINFGREEDEHFQLATDFDDLLGFLLAEVRAGKWQADVLDDGKKIPWFGDLDESFFNTLHGRWKKRTRGKAAKSPRPQVPTEVTKARKLQEKAGGLKWKGKFEAAYETMLEVQALVPTWLDVLVDISELAMKAGRFEDAEKHFAELAVRADHDVSKRDVYFHQRISNLVNNLGNRKLAIKLTRARSAKEPANEGARMSLTRLEAGDAP